MVFSAYYIYPKHLDILTPFFFYFKYDFTFYVDADNSHEMSSIFSQKQTIITKNNNKEKKIK